MAQLPLLSEISALSTRWKALLDPILGRPTNNVQILSGIVLKSGANTINHGLGRTMQGWYLTDNNASVTVYRSQPMNSTTLTLTASGAATVNIGVF